MPVETTVTRCGNCGAALARHPEAASLTCAYCAQTTYLTPTAAMPSRAAPAVTATAHDDALHARLVRGPDGAQHGVARRYTPAEMATRDVLSWERGLWPSQANASSTFGGSWSPSALLGSPRVFPRDGDLGGAWAPASHNSPSEWIEVEYPHDVPVAAVRVFETHRAGSTYAVVDLTDGERLLYAGPPRVESGARVLEVSVDPPRPLRRLRVYVVNPGWAEIDTVGLLAAQPLPEALRTRAPSLLSPSSWSFTAIALVGVVLLALLGAVIGGARARQAGHPTPPPRPALSVGGATLAYGADPLVRPTVWASTVEGFSTQYSSSRNAASDALGAPDVYPRYGDVDGAWASHDTDHGAEWITVRFPTAVSASSVLWVETLNPGAVVRLDDVSDPAHPAVLWEGGASAPAGASAVAEVTLPSPRSVSAVRLVLDTRRVAGWNEIDAIGLVPAP